MEAEYGAELGGGPPFGAPSSRVLLGELLDRIGRIEADFTLRWDAAHLGTPMSAHQQDLRPEWPRHA